MTIWESSLLSLTLCRVHYIPCKCNVDGYVIDTPSLKLIDHNSKILYCLIENMPKKSLECQVPILEMVKELTLSFRASTMCQLAFD